MQPEVVEFMRTVMDHLDVESPRELARAIGFVGDKERVVYRWVSGESAPDFHHMLMLLDAARLLKEEIAGWYGALMK